MSTGEPKYKILEKRKVGPGAWVLRFDRKNLEFSPGQHLSVSPPGSRDFREYSIYSGTEQEFLEILLKEVEGGKVSLALAACKPGDFLSLWGPIGFFTLPAESQKDPLLFIATGTGISPFHSFVLSRPGLDYRLVHGIRDLEEAYEADTFPSSRYISCTSRSQDGIFSGRVTRWLETQTLEPQTQIYLCGNCDMIYEVFDQLKARGFSSRQIFSEVYF